MDETKYISDGIALGYEGAALNKYVSDRIVRETKRIKDDDARNDRLRDREDRKAAEELELKKIELELAKVNINSDVPRNNVNASRIKLNPYKDRRCSCVPQNV